MIFSESMMIIKTNTSGALVDVSSSFVTHLERTKEARASSHTFQGKFLPISTVFELVLDYSQHTKYSHTFLKITYAI